MAGQGSAVTKEAISSRPSAVNLLRTKITTGGSSGDRALACRPGHQLSPSTGSLIFVPLVARPCGRHRILPRITTLLWNLFLSVITCWFQRLKSCQFLFNRILAWRLWPASQGARANKVKVKTSPAQNNRCCAGLNMDLSFLCWALAKALAGNLIVDFLPIFSLFFLTGEQGTNRL